MLQVSDLFPCLATRPHVRGPGPGPVAWSHWPEPMPLEKLATYDVIVPRHWAPDAGTGPRTQGLRKTLHRFSDILTI